MVNNKHSFKNVRVLIVDDDRQILNLLESQLLLRGYHVDVAENGQTALKKIQDKNYNVVVTDIVMPKVDGLELLEDAVYYLSKPIDFAELEEMLTVATNFSLGKLIDLTAKTYLKLKNAHERDSQQRLMNLKVELKKILLFKLDVELFNEFVDKKGLKCSLGKLLDEKFSTWSVTKY